MDDDYKTHELLNRVLYISAIAEVLIRPQMRCVTRRVCVCGIGWRM